MRHLFSLPIFLLLALPCPAADVFAPANRVAWCVVPFDAKKRGPAERVEMLKRLGFTKYAYDWRAEHVASFGDELAELKKAGITLQGVWFPADYGPTAEGLLETVNKAKLKTELWVMLPQPDAKLSQDEKVKAAALRVKRLARWVKDDGHKVGIYNHGGWSGEPANMAAVVTAADEPNVGIVYNLHHGHDHLAKLADHLALMKSHLYCLNLNGMKKDGDKNGQKILCIGEGDDDARLLKTIRDSGYTGPVGILGHTDHDVEDRLADNLNGLDCLLRNDGFTPLYRTQSAGVFHDVIQLEIKAADKPSEFVFTPKLGNVYPKIFTYWLKVFVSKPGLRPKDYDQAQPVTGSRTTTAENFRFTPRFPPQPGTTYRVFFGKQTAEFTIPIPNTPPVVVEQVYPTAGVLPENTLRMYVHFSAPVKKGDIYKHIKLMRDDGVEVASPFLELDEELWSPDGKRLTLLFYPGRVKRGLVPREEAGPILEEGKQYTLFISKDWPDEYGRPLKAEFRKAFSVVKPDDTGIDPAKWELGFPNRMIYELVRNPQNHRPGGDIHKFTTDSTLQVKFGQSKRIDRALAERLIWVVDEDGRSVDKWVGKTVTETDLKFGENLKRWPAGKYKLVIDTRLEDVCGNRVGRPFEIDMLKPVTKQIEAKTVEIPFEVK